MKLLNLFGIIAVVACQACGNGDKSRVEADNDIDLEYAFEDFQGDSSAVYTYLISDSCAGPFRIGATIPLRADGFVRTEYKESKTDSAGNTTEHVSYIYEIGNEGWVKITPQYDIATGCASDKTGEIFIYSDLFLTDKGIGAMSSIEEYAAAYPDFKISHTPEAELFVVETPELRNVQFVISDECYLGSNTVFTSDRSCELQLSDFKDEFCFSAIRIIK